MFTMRIDNYIRTDNYKNKIIRIFRKLQKYAMFIMRIDNNNLSQEQMN